MNEMGMIIGAHGHSHEIITNLDKISMEHEIEKSIFFIRKEMGIECTTFAYPFGGAGTHNTKVYELLKRKGIDYAFAVDHRDITNYDISSRRYALPRYDCNNFKFGKSEVEIDKTINF